MQHNSLSQGILQFSCKSVQEETPEILIIHVTLTEFKLISTPRPTSRCCNEMLQDISHLSTTFHKEETSIRVNLRVRY